MTILPLKSFSFLNLLFNFYASLKQYGKTSFANLFVKILQIKQKGHKKRGSPKLFTILNFLFLNSDFVNCFNRDLMGGGGYSSDMAKIRIKAEICL
jgi:hypothetical protein